MKKVIFGLVFLLMFVFGVSSGYAAEFRVEKDNGNITVSAGETVKNLYTGGNVVTISADVGKSLYAGGNVVTISGDVEDNVMVGGGTVTISGDVYGSVHAGGGTVTIEGAIEDDLFVGGGTVVLSESASVGGDLFVGGGLVTINGSVVGDVFLGARQAVINGKVGGEIKAEVESLEFGEKAEITGDVFYKSVDEAVMNEGAVIGGEVSFNKIDRDSSFGSKFEVPSKKSFLGIVGFGLVIKMMVTLVASLFLLYFFKKWLVSSVKKTLKDFWPNLGVGFVGTIITPLAILFLMISVLGIWLAGLTGLIYMVIMTLAAPLASILFGSWLMKIFRKQSEYTVDWQVVVLGVVALGLVGLVPMLGWLTKAVFMLAGLGTLYRFVLGQFKAGRSL